NKDVISLSIGDESIALLVVKPFYCTCHCVTLHKKIKISCCAASCKNRHGLSVACLTIKVNGFLAGFVKLYKCIFVQNSAIFAKQLEFPRIAIKRCVCLPKVLI